PFEDIKDPETGKTRVRRVNTKSIQYRIARQYMIRLEKKDFEPGLEFVQLAVAARMSPDEFRERFEYVTSY
ncbi:MAG: 6-phosphofructokinase, partial [Synergistaceae bacterium]|nr:6-phosphofructokinase [Synergistaceae bacterium]